MPWELVWLDPQTKTDIIRTSHKWFWCCLCLSRDHDADIDLHLSATARAFWANTWISCDKHVPIALYIKFFEAVVTPIACFGARRRKIYQHQVLKYDVEWRRLWRTVLGPPPGLDWSMQWLQSVHSLNRRVLDYRKNITCKVGLRHVFPTVGNSSRTSQVFPSRIWVRRQKWQREGPLKNPVGPPLGCDFSARLILQLPEFFGRRRLAPWGP